MRPKDRLDEIIETVCSGPSGPAHGRVEYMMRVVAEQSFAHGGEQTRSAKHPQFDSVFPAVLGGKQFTDAEKLSYFNFTFTEGRKSNCVRACCTEGGYGSDGHYDRRKKARK